MNHPTILVNLMVWLVAGVTSHILGERANKHLSGDEQFRLAKRP